MLIFPLNVFPWVINGLIEAWVSLKRVNRFLKLEELDWQEFYSSNIEDVEADSGAMMVVEDGHFTWNVEEVNGGEYSIENNDGLHSNDVLKHERKVEKNVEDEKERKCGHTQDLQNINLSVYKVGCFFNRGLWYWAIININFSVKGSACWRHWSCGVW